MKISYRSVEGEVKNEAARIDRWIFGGIIFRPVEREVKLKTGQ